MFSYIIVANIVISWSAMWIHMYVVHRNTRLDYKFFLFHCKEVYITEAVLVHKFAVSPVVF